MHLTRTVVLSTGERIVIPSITLTVSVDSIVNEYYDSFRRVASTPTGATSEEAVAGNNADCIDGDAVESDDDVDDVAPAGAATLQQLCTDHQLA